MAVDLADFVPFWIGLLLCCCCCCYCWWYAVYIEKVNSLTVCMIFCRCWLLVFVDLLGLGLVFGRAPKKCNFNKRPFCALKVLSKRRKRALVEVNVFVVCCCCCCVGIGRQASLPSVVFGRTFGRTNEVA